MAEEHQFDPAAASAAFDNNVSSAVPNGYCETCSMAKMKINGAVVCPNCTSAGAPQPTMVDIVMKDGTTRKVTEEEALRLEGRLEKMQKVEKRIARLEGREFDPTRVLPDGSKGVAAPVKSLGSRGPGSLVVKPVTLSVDEIFSILDGQLSSAKFSDLAQAKKILGLRKKLALFKIELGDFLGGN